MTGIIVGILMFMILVMIHELGHFLTAKKGGIKVLEFGIGIPPKVCKLRTDKSGTEYTLNLLPLGGFVRLKGEDPKDPEDFLAPDSFIKAKLGRKIIVLLAGVTANFLLAWVLFTTVFTIGTKPISIVPENAMVGESTSYLMPTKTFLYEHGYISEEAKKSIESMPVLIDAVMDDMPGKAIGLQTGDSIETINKTPVNAWNIESLIKQTQSGEIQIGYTRNNKHLIGKTSCAGETCVLGIAFSYTGINQTKDNVIQPIKFPLGTAMIISLQEIKAQTKLTLAALGSLGKNLVSFDKKKMGGALSKLTGPVGAIKFGDTLLKGGQRVLFLAFAGMISLALAIFNVLPIPAVDGGRLLGVLIQGLGKLKPEKYFTIESYINLVFFVLLMGLGVIVIFKDLGRFWGIKIPFMG